jgi:hypothetical protein
MVFNLLYMGFGKGNPLSWFKEGAQDAGIRRREP